MAVRGERSSDEQGSGTRRSDRNQRLLLLFPAACLAFLVGELAYLTVGSLDPAASRAEVLDSVSFALATLAWNALVPAALVVLVLLGPRTVPKGMPVIVVTCAVFTIAIVGLLLEMNVDESSTAVLLLIFLPLELGLALLPFLGLTVLVHQLRVRRSAAGLRPR